MNICEEYDVTKQTVLDISKSKDKLVEYSVKYLMHHQVKVVKVQRGKIATMQGEASDADTASIT
ncbi:hypothetical protein E2C01_051603 [Portunus trituberculatus]|uniref:Uncharacterized protein n=1 Tax=Portunus trituberculatus TaxID=210409 RepID=A0A5B7GKS4_PORTR|nr:hypothetical protein [Portunus trituberculatus]